MSFTEDRSAYTPRQKISEKVDLYAPLILSKRTARLLKSFVTDELVAKAPKPVQCK
jgi:hypothetical protein